MTELFARWTAQIATDSAMRLQMFIIGFLLVGLWETLEAWPKKWRNVGRWVYIISGGIIYAVFVGISVYTLVDFLSRYW
jgi:hypothetical protein